MDRTGGVKLTHVQGEGRRMWFPLHITTQDRQCAWALFRTRFDGNGDMLCHRVTTTKWSLSRRVQRAASGSHTKDALKIHRQSTSYISCVVFVVASFLKLSDNSNTRSVQ